MRVAIATFFALALVLAFPACAQPVEKFQAGKHYFAIDPVQPTSSGDKIEVLEVFMYTCPHCYDLEPYLTKWKATAPADVAYSAFPAAWNEPVEAFARAFYAAETLGILEKSHEKFFAAIHKERLPLRSLDDIAQWYTQFGVTKEAFLSASNSFAVNTKINRSKAMVPRWGVEGTPAVIVNGKYRFDVSSAGGHQNIAELIDFLVAKERAAKKGA
ncbi:MAG TPA: thiol:disulfide interchange protein DsbA/DsbL [Xanthomonadales bacterium]|nr:thiol:disulfide interchange protein DsbA/DsbL [Xanthomonadales bacterium]